MLLTKGVPDPEISVLCHGCRINTYVKSGGGFYYYAITFLHSLLLLKTVMWHMGATPSPLLYNVPGNDAKYDKIIWLKFTFVYFALSSTQNVIHVIQNVKINAKCSKHEIYGNRFLSLIYWKCILVFIIKIENQKKKKKKN